MNIEIKKLTPGLAEDYIRFFDITPHDDNSDENKCYCVCWCSADHRIKTDFSSAKKRRDLAVQYINGGILQGYLAYYHNQVVGWCNANTKLDCMNCISWLRFMQPVSSIMDDLNSKTKSVFCFVIAPSMQRKGVATKLLERVCKDAANDGFDYVEAYPRKSFVSVPRDFTGPVEMYKKCGFTLYAELDNDEILMRKELREGNA